MYTNEYNWHWRATFFHVNELSWSYLWSSIAEWKSQSKNTNNFLENLCTMWTTNDMQRVVGRCIWELNHCTFKHESQHLGHFCCSFWKVTMGVASFDLHACLQQQKCTLLHTYWHVKIKTYMYCHSSKDVTKSHFPGYTWCQQTASAKSQTVLTEDSSSRFFFYSELPKWGRASCSDWHMHITLTYLTNSISAQKNKTNITFYWIWLFRRCFFMGINWQ